MNESDSNDDGKVPVPVIDGTDTITVSGEDDSIKVTES